MLRIARFAMLFAAGCALPLAGCGGFEFHATISKRADAREVASFTVHGRTYTTDAATVDEVFGSFADAQAAGTAVVATTTSGARYAFVLVPTACGDGNCDVPGHEKCADLTDETEEWTFTTGLLAAPGSGSAPDFVLAADRGDCTYADGTRATWTD